MAPLVGQKKITTIFFFEHTLFLILLNLFHNSLIVPHNSSSFDLMRRAILKGSAQEVTPMLLSC